MGLMVEPASQGCRQDEVRDVTCLEQRLVHSVLCLCLLSERAKVQVCNIEQGGQCPSRWRVTPATAESAPRRGVRGGEREGKAAWAGRVEGQARKLTPLRM